MIILKGTRNRSFILSLEDTFFEKEPPPAVLVLSYLVFKK